MEFFRILMSTGDLINNRLDIAEEGFFSRIAKGGALERGAYYFLFSLLIIICVAVFMGVTYGCVRAIALFVKDGLFHNVADYLLIALFAILLIVTIGETIFDIRLLISIINDIRKTTKKMKSLPDISSAVDDIEKAKAILIEPESDALDDVVYDWYDWFDFWSSESYDVKKLIFKQDFSNSNSELERCAFMYEYVLSGKCTALEGEDGAYAMMKSDVRNKIIGGKTFEEVLDSQEAVRDAHPVLYEALVYINETIKRIEESNNEVLAEYAPVYRNHPNKERIIKDLYIRTECYALVQECWRKKRNTSNCGSN